MTSGSKVALSATRPSDGNCALSLFALAHSRDTTRIIIVIANDTLRFGAL